MGETGGRDLRPAANNLEHFGPDRIREQLRSILSSQAFRGAQAQQAFISYVVGESVAGRGHLIKEYLIGIEALHRGDAFDPRLDPIVRTQASKLRTRLRKYYETEGATDPLLIEIPRGSYAPVFRPAGQGTSEFDIPSLPGPSVPAATQSSPQPATNPQGLRSLTLLAFLVVLAVAGTGAAAFYALQSEWWEQIRPHEAPSVAVMPFIQVGDRNDRDSLRVGLADEVINALRGVPGLEVVASTPTLPLKGKLLEIPGIGSNLHVQTELLGFMRTFGDKLRIDVQLNTSRGKDHLWSGSYERDAVEVRSVPSEIAGAISSVLGLDVPSSPATILAGRPARVRVPANPSAYQNYLKGLYFWNKLTPEGLRLAVQYLGQAISEDPSFARAYSALANCYVMAPQVATAPPPEVLSKIRATALRALQLDSTLGEAHFSLAIAAEYEFQWALAEAEFRKGLALSPGNSVGHLWYAKYLALLGRKEEVLAHRRIAAELDPVSPYAVQAVGGYFSVMGQYDKAIQHFSSALALDPGFGLAHQGLGVAYLLKGMPDEAIAELQQADRLMSGPRRRALLGYAYALSGRTDEARRILDEFLVQASAESFPALAIAQIYIGFGDKDRAFEWLQKAIDQRDLDVTLLWDSPYESLRSDPRFTALLRRMKLA